MTLNKDVLQGSSTSPKDSSLEKEFQVNNINPEAAGSLLLNKATKDLSIIGSHYSNSIQMEDYVSDPKGFPTSKFALMPLYAELSELDDSFAAFKGVSSTLSKFSSPALGYTGLGLTSRSYISVFNNFRSDFEDFN